ncbi:hypothetical protein GEOBRER4_n1546 [Citrifermentans bremense]|uniref:Uncharacterized protein n=1 Tax=Citrifermentans bremense TaxID=60035 RepID=A0A7R7FS37_9BACT|nr:hypothetical protein GEOBRER4_n1546 [Citrifermentans bremense]
MVAENKKSLRPSKGRRLSESFRGTTLIHPPLADLIDPLRGWTAPASTRHGSKTRVSLRRLKGEFTLLPHRFAPTTGSLKGKEKATTPRHCLYISSDNRKNRRLLSSGFSV